MEFLASHCKAMFSEEKICFPDPNMPSVEYDLRVFKAQVESRKAVADAVLPGDWHLFPKYVANKLLQFPGAYGDLPTFSKHFQDLKSCAP